MLGDDQPGVLRPTLDFGGYPLGRGELRLRADNSDGAVLAPWKFVRRAAFAQGLQMFLKGSQE